MVGGGPVTPYEIPPEVAEMIRETGDKMAMLGMRGTAQDYDDWVFREKLDEVDPEQAAAVHALNSEVAFMLGIGDPLMGTCQRVSATCLYCGRREDPLRDSCRGCGAPYE